MYKCPVTVRCFDFSSTLRRRQKRKVEEGKVGKTETSFGSQSPGSGNEESFLVDW